MQKGMLLNSLNIKSTTVDNAIIQLGAIDDTGKGRHFVSRFIKDGLVKIEGHGIVLLKKETLDASLQSMVGTPVIIKHQNVTKENADKLRIGTISKAYFNEPDGWFYCEGIIWDEKAQDLIENKNWSVSCSYDFLAYNDEGGEENNIHYDKEFTNLNFTHLAIVDNPRYERANIVFNCKIDNADDQKGKWVTIKGNHIFIPDGKTLDEVIKEKGWGDKEDKQTDGESKHGFKKDKDSGYYMKDLPDGTSVYVEKKEGGQGEKEPFYLEATHFDKDGKTIAKKQYHYDSMDGMFGKIDKDFVSEEKQLDTKDKQPQKITKQMDVERIIDEHYEDDMITKEYADQLSKILGTKISEDDIYKAMEGNAYSSESGDYDISKMAKDIVKVAKEKKKKEKEYEEWHKELRKESLLEYDLKSMLKDITKDADYNYDKERKTLEVRYLGDWEGDDGSGDYDWQHPTEETVEKVKEIKEKFKKRFGYELSSDWGEKNWYYFKIKETKKNKTNNSKENDMAILEELKKFIFKIENEKENEMDSKSKILSILNEKEVDKETIEEIKNELEKIEEEKKEVENKKKVKNEEKEEVEEEKEEKVENEDEEDKEDKKEVKEVKEEVKEDVDNKCKNSKEDTSSFDKINEIYNSVRQLKETKTYVSRQEKLDNAVEYFK